MLRIALIGDFDPTITAHQAIPVAVALSASKLGQIAEVSWLPTKSLEGEARDRLTRFSGVWCVPGSPYVSMGGALAAIRAARESSIPFLGTCGGFQHVLIEYARNVLGLAAADHAESNPDAPLRLVAPLACGLVEARGRIQLVSGSIAALACGSAELEEEFNCRYGFNEEHRSLLADSLLRTTGIDEHGSMRVVELADHPFFVATLFQPERRALRNEAHPLVTAFVAAAAAAARR